MEIPSIKISPFIKGLPIGTILTVIDEKAKPEGWLLCDGKEIDPKYSYLIKLIGKYTPNLTGRTLIGAGEKVMSINSNNESANFSKEKFTKSEYGGEFRTQLKKEHLPRHDHNLTLKRFKFKAGTNTFSSDNEFEVAKEYGENYKKFKEEYWKEGNDVYHNNMQPYFTVFYIIYTGE